MVRSMIFCGVLIAGSAFAGSAIGQNLEARIHALEKQMEKNAIEKQMDKKPRLKCIRTTNTSPTTNSPIMGPKEENVDRDYVLVSLGCRMKPDEVHESTRILEFSPERCYVKNAPGVSLTSIATFCRIEYE